MLLLQSCRGSPWGPLTMAQIAHCVPKVLLAPGLLPLAPLGQEQLPSLGDSRDSGGHGPSLVCSAGCSDGSFAVLPLSGVAGSPPWWWLSPGFGWALSVTGVVSCMQLRQLEMQLEQEYEEKQMVLHEKQDLEGLIATLCEQVRGQYPPWGQHSRDKHALLSCCCLPDR